MAIEEEDLAPRRMPAKKRDLGPMSVAEMHGYIAEMEEEIGISGLDLEFVGKYYFEAVDATGKVRKWNHLYKAEIDFTPDQLNPEEVSEVRWFNLKDIKAMISEKPEDFTDGVIEVIKRYY